MAQAETLREFLVKLGFQVDEKGYKRFTTGVEAATKSVVKLVGTIQAAALTVSAGVAAFASNMEALYFAAQKTGASAGGIKAFSAAVKNLTGNGEDAIASMQGLARFMRNQPGAEGLLASIGVQARDANGQLRKTEDIMADLGVELAKKPYYLAKQYGDMLGIGEDTLRAIMSGDFAAELARQRALVKDAGYEEATKKAHAFMEKLRELQTRIASVGVTIGSSLLDALGPQMDAAAKWFEENADEIAQAVSAFGSVIVSVSEYVLPILGKIVEGWKQIYHWTKAGGRALVDAMPESWADKIGAGTGWVLDKLGIRDKVDRALGFGPSTPPPAAPGAASKTDPMAFFQKMGWSKEQAAGIVANLRHESNLSPTASGDNGRAYGIAQWHPDRQAAFKRWAGKDIKQSTLEEQLAFVHHELTAGEDFGARRAGALLKASGNAAQAGEIVSRHYERPLRTEEEARRRSATAVQIAQTTNINVTGSGDPSATGRAVASEQGRVNQTLTRNLQTAVN